MTSERVFEAARNESYLEDSQEKMGGRTSETLYRCRCGCKLGESKTYVLLFNGHGQHKHDKCSLQTQ